MSKKLDKYWRLTNTRDASRVPGNVLSRRADEADPY